MTIELRSGDTAVAELVLDRPEQLNAFRRQDVDAALAAITAAERDRSLRALVVRGEGRAFCAGADRGLLAEIEALEPTERIAAMRPGVALALGLARFARPTVAAVQGACYGGGIGLALACDVVVAGSDLRLGLVFTELALPGGDYVAPWLLSRRAGTRRTWRLLAEAAVLDAPAALDLGLVDEVVDPTRVAERAREIAAGLAARPPQALAATKRQILELEGGGSELDAQVERQLEDLARAFGGAEYAAARELRAQRLATPSTKN